jgi:hypothetical protein
MGRTIPSFRQLLEIEKLDWSDFKKSLSTKKERKAFDEIFENAKLYTSYLPNAVNPIVFESVMMGASFACIHARFPSSMTSLLHGQLQFSIFCIEW